MGSGLKKLLLTVLVVSLFSGTANAATTKASPTPTTSATKKTSPSPTPKTTVTAKATTTPKTTVTAKATPKPTATKKIVIYKPRPKVKVSPSPSAIWPPNGYYKDKENPDIYAKVPTSKELIGLASANKNLAAALQACKTMTCGAILAGSLAGCNWWEFSADVFGPTSDTDATLLKYGSVASLFNSSKPKQVMPFVLITQEPIKNGFTVSNIKITCHREAIPTDLKVPSNTYLKN